MKKIVYNSTAYILITFPWAILWHVVFFRDYYDQLGFFGQREPIFAFGFMAILVQGVVLALAHDRMFRHPASTADTAAFTALAFFYLWASHVLAYAAKNKLTSVSSFVGFESLYLMLQFVFFGIALYFINRR